MIRVFTNQSFGPLSAPNEMLKLPNMPQTRMEVTLPSSWYLETSIYALEREHIFMQEWQCVGRQEDIPKPGDHRVLDVQGESVILLRNGDNQLRAFYNVCRHRGARLCAGGDTGASLLKGGVSSKFITCPYHAWIYDLDGQLVRARDIPEDCDFNTGDFRLYPVAAESWGGFIFIHMTPGKAKPLAEHVALVAERFKRYRMQDLRVGKTLSYTVEANWKVICENYNECYHCGPVHPELCRIVPAFRENAGSGLEWDKGVPHRPGAVTFTLTGTTNRRTFPDLNADEQVLHYGELVYPNLFLSLSSDHVAAFLLRPDGPNRTHVDCHLLFEPYEIERREFNPDDAADFWDLVNRQDWEICKRVQQGMSSRVFEHGFCAPMEDLTIDIRKYVTDRIGPYLPA
jgi:Rieske 2Fe-2S family protein